jgi:hypothetical protein
MAGRNLRSHSQIPLDDEDRHPVEREAVDDTPNITEGNPLSNLDIDLPNVANPPSVIHTHDEHEDTPMPDDDHFPDRTPFAQGDHYDHHIRDPSSAQPRNAIPANFQDTLLSLLGESASSKGTDVRAPDKFNGTDRSKFRTYIAQCRLVFRANPRKFNTDTKQVTYACSYLDGLAFQWYQNALELDEDPQWFDSWTLFKDELQAQFGEVNTEAAAERDIRLLNMKTNDQITMYITKFHTFANNLSWNDEALVSEFRRGLAGRIKDELQHVDRDDWTLRDLEARCLRIDYRYWERQQEKSSDPSEPRVVAKTTTTIQQFENNHRSSRDPRRRQDRRPQRTTTSTTINTSRTNDNALPLDQSGHLKANERQRRIDNNLCPYCGGKHTLDNCPKKTNRGPQRENNRMASTTFSVQGKE